MVDVDDARRHVGFEPGGNHGVDRQHHLALGLLRLIHDGLRGVDEVALDQRAADILAHRHQERVGHGAADDQHIDARQKVTEQVELGGNLGAADDGRDRALRLVEHLLEGFEFGLQRAPGEGGEHMGDAFGRGMRAVRHREGVVDVDVAEASELGDEGRVVRLLAGVEARVLEA